MTQSSAWKRSSNRPGRRRTSATNSLHWLPLAAFHQHQGHYDKAVKYLKRAAARAGKVGDSKYEEWALLCLGVSYERLGQEPKGIEAYAKALEIARKRDDARRLSDWELESSGIPPGFFSKDCFPGPVRFRMNVERAEVRV